MREDTEFWATQVRGTIQVPPLSEAVQTTRTTFVSLPVEELVLHLLFVCTGNICRSPIAERLAVAFGNEMGFSHLKASSAGTRAVIDRPMQVAASDVLASLGADSSGFVARQLTRRIADGSDLVLTMTKVQRDRVLELAPNRMRTIFSLDEAAQLASNFDVINVAGLADVRPLLPAAEVTDIPDPIGQDYDFFASVGSMIADRLPPVLRLCAAEYAQSADGETK